VEGTMKGTNKGIKDIEKALENFMEED